MKKLILYGLLVLGVVTGCEDIYVPDLDKVDNVIVADARLIQGNTDNYIRLTQTQGFNEESKRYAPVEGGEVFLMDNSGNEFKLTEKDTGLFHVHVALDTTKAYKIRIEHMGNTFESEFESVPDVPDIDTFYGALDTKTIESGGNNETEDLKKVKGVQLFADMPSNSQMPNFRFTGKLVKLEQWIEQDPDSFKEVVYHGWDTELLGGVYNIAAPPEYSSSTYIEKHPIYFIQKPAYFGEDVNLRGWILVLYQHAISNSSYNYYNDLNAQLDAEGRIFDPVYVQARSNIKCTNKPDEIILGNFEIATITEHRYYIRYISETVGHTIKVVYNREPIPPYGLTVDEPPPFWVY